MERVNGQNTSLDKTKEELLKKVRGQEQKLYSIEIVLAFQQEPDQAKRKAFLEERERYRDARIKLENEILEKRAANLKSLEPELKKAIDDLEVAIQTVKNTVAILSTIQKVTSIVARIVKIV